MCKVNYVEARLDFKVYVVLDDHRAGEIDLSNELWGEVFEPLKDPELFAKVKIDEVGDSVCWPTGADLAPEFIDEHIPVNPAYAHG